MISKALSIEICWCKFLLFLFFPISPSNVILSRCESKHFIISLLERINLASSNIGDIILDPCGGTFTTAKVAVTNNRKCISCDLNYDYFKIGLRRTNLFTEYDGEILVPDKSRKTKNKSKADHNVEKNN